MEPIRILVLDKGIVIVGRCPDPRGCPFWLSLTNTRTIRRWGTTRGIEQLVGGPTAGTVLDAEAASESVPVRAVIRVIDVDQKAWSSHVGG